MATRSALPALVDPRTGRVFAYSTSTGREGASTRKKGRPHRQSSIELGSFSLDRVRSGDRGSGRRHLHDGELSGSQVGSGRMIRGQCSCPSHSGKRSNRSRRMPSSSFHTESRWDAPDRTHSTFRAMQRTSQAPSRTVPSPSDSTSHSSSMGLTDEYEPALQALGVVVQYETAGINVTYGDLWHAKLEETIPHEDYETFLKDIKATHNRFEILSSYVNEVLQADSESVSRYVDCFVVGGHMFDCTHDDLTRLFAAHETENAEWAKRLCESYKGTFEHFHERITYNEYERTLDFYREKKVIDRDINGDLSGLDRDLLRYFRIPRGLRLVPKVEDGSFSINVLDTAGNVVNTFDDFKEALAEQGMRMDVNEQTRKVSLFVPKKQRSIPVAFYQNIKIALKEKVMKRVEDDLSRYQDVLDELGMTYRFKEDRDALLFVRPGAEEKDSVIDVKLEDVRDYLDSLHGWDALKHKLHNIIEDFFHPLRHKAKIRLEGGQVVIEYTSTPSTGGHNHPPSAHNHSHLKQFEKDHDHDHDHGHHHHHDHGHCHGHGHSHHHHHDHDLDSHAYRRVKPKTELDKIEALLESVVDDDASVGSHDSHHSHEAHDAHRSDSASSAVGSLRGGDVDLDKFSVSIPFSELKPLLENDLQDRDARLKLIEVLSLGVLNEFTQEANRIPVPGDGYDELALLFNSSGLSERLLWAINLSIFTAGTGMLYKHGVLHAKGELDEAREARAHLLGVTHRISHLDERINEETAKLESEISKLEKKHGDLLSRINRDDRRATSGEKASLSKNEDQIRDLTERKIVLTEASERISEEKDKVKKAMTHINWVVADAAFELSGLLLMTGGTMAGMSQSIALAVKTFHEGTIASNAVTAMEFSTVGAHAFLALGSLCTMFTGARAFYNGISPTKTEFKRQVAELESNKATLMSKRDPLKAEIRALEQKHVTGEFTPEETKLLDTKKLELQLLGELETVFDDVKHYVEAEGDFESRSLMLRGANLFVGSGLLAFFNTSHVLVDAGLIMSAQSPLEGPAGLVVLGVGVTMVMVGLMVGLFREGQASKHRVVDFASSHLRHEFETKVQLVRDLIKVSTSDTEVVDTLLDTFARSFAKKEFDAANHAWQVRKQIELQLRPGRKRGVPTDQKIKRLVKEDAHAGHFEWRRFFKAKINYGPLSIREVFKENEGAVLNVHDGSVAGRVERHASARIVSDFLTSVHAHSDSTRGTRARAGFNFGSGTEKSELAQAWIDYLHRQGQLEIVLEGMARDASLSQLISSVRHRRATKMNDYREKVTIHSKDKKKLYQQPKRVFAFVGNAFATAGSWMKYGAKRCLSENPMRPDGWSKYFNDSGYSKRARVTRVNVAAVMQDIRANKGDVIDSFFDESVRVFFSNKGPGRRVDLVYRGRVVSAAKAQVDPSVLLAA